MAAVISLKEVVDVLEAENGDVNAYLNKNTGETRFISNLDTFSLEMEEEGEDEDVQDWEREDRQATCEVLESEDWLKLPDSFTIHEYRILKGFCYSVPNERLSEELLDKISGAGAFRRFKDTIYRRGIEEQWFAFNRKALVEIAIDWLEENGLEYTHDGSPDKG